MTRKLQPKLKTRLLPALGVQRSLPLKPAKPNFTRVANIVNQRTVSLADVRTKPGSSSGNRNGKSNGKDNSFSKFRARRTECGAGHSHPSKLEALRCDELHLMQRAGVIKNLEQQPVYTLQAGFVHEGVKIRPITYIADFRYFDIEKDRQVIEDTKGYRTQVFRLKRKLLLKRLSAEKDPALFIET